MDPEGTTPAIIGRSLPMGFVANEEIKTDHNVVGQKHVPSVDSTSMVGSDVFPKLIMLDLSRPSKHRQSNPSAVKGAIIALEDVSTDYGSTPINGHAAANARVVPLEQVVLDQR
jgi:hypothetical protein